MKALLESSESNSEVEFLDYELDEKKWKSLLKQYRRVRREMRKLRDSYSPRYIECSSLFGPTQKTDPKCPYVILERRINALFPRSKDRY